MRLNIISEVLEVVSKERILQPIDCNFVTFSAFFILGLVTAKAGLYNCMIKPLVFFTISFVLINSSTTSSVFKNPKNLECEYV